MSPPRRQLISIITGPRRSSRTSRWKKLWRRRKARAVATAYARIAGAPRAGPRRAGWRWPSSSNSGGPEWTFSVTARTSTRSPAA